MNQRNFESGLTRLIAPVIIGAGILIGTSSYSEMSPFVALRNGALANGDLKGAILNQTLDDIRESTGETDYDREQKAKQTLAEHEARTREMINEQRTREKINEQRTREMMRERRERTEAVFEIAPGKKVSLSELENTTIFTFVKWIDLDNDGVVEYTELHGIGYSFPESGPMAIAVQNMGVAKNVREVIYGPKGEILRDWTFNMIHNQTMGAPSENWEKVFKPLIKEGGVGKYKVAVYFEGKLQPVHDFEITKTEEKR